MWRSVCRGVVRLAGSEEELRPVWSAKKSGRLFGEDAQLIFTLEQFFLRYREHLDDQYNTVAAFFGAKESYYHLWQRKETTRPERLNHGQIDQDPQYGILDENGSLVLGPSEEVRLPSRPLSSFTRVQEEDS